MKILISANSVHGFTGYSTQARGMARAFQSLGHSVAVAAFYGVNGGMLTIEGVPTYCNLRDNWGQDVVGSHVRHFGADVCLTLHDAWVLGDGFQQKAGVPWICYSPIDSVPAAPATVRIMRQARFPLVYSKFGLEQMKQAGVQCDYVPHGIDCDVFKPGDKAEARRRLGLPADGFICAMVAANKGYPSRKAFPEQLTAFATFKQKHPEAVLFLHTQKTPIGYWADGIQFDALLSDLKLDDVYFSNEYLSSQGLFTERDVAMVYQAADVLLAASYAEGFGLPIAEAQAAGCPVITTNFSSMPELTFNGISAGIAQRTWNPLGCWQAIPSIEGIADAIEAIYISEKVPAEDSHRAIAEQYGWPVVTQMWGEFLAKVEDEITMIRGARSQAAD